MRPLRLGVIVGTSDGSLTIEEANTGHMFLTTYTRGGSPVMNPNKLGLAPAGPTRHVQGAGCALKRPEQGDAVFFEAAADEILTWGYINRFLLLTEQRHPSRLVPRLLP